jgi:hypothetical protein
MRNVSAPEPGLRGVSGLTPLTVLRGHGVRAGSVTFSPQQVGYHRYVTEESAQPLQDQLEEIRTQLAWVRDYL